MTREERRPERRQGDEEPDPIPRRVFRPQRLAISRNGMAATAHYRATEAAVELLEAGANAVDAAVAAAFALGVCEPAASGLGGQTMMLLHHAASRRVVALDGSSRAPNRATVEALSNPERRRGYKATTVPSTPAVLAYALRRYGTRKRADVLRPAIRLAEEGCEITPLQHALAKRELKHLRSGSAGRIFLKGGQRSYPAGARFRQPVLAATLRRLAKEGLNDFYRGRIARMIHDDMVRNGGLIRRDDLARIPRPIERRPLTARFGTERVFTFPPPGAGRTLVLMLNVFQHLAGKRWDPDSPEGALLLAEVIRRAFLDRNDRPFDPSYYAQVEDKRMLNPRYAKLVARQVRSRFERRGETTHLSVMDRWGNAVALTQSIERPFGACEAHPELGFLYNNYMSDFEYDDISHPYYLRPNAAPWASVAPTILMRGKRPRLAIGSPGSERITPVILQVLLRLRRQQPYEAVAAPRLYCALDGTVSLEASRMRDDIPRALESRGFTIDVREPYSFYLGSVQLVMREKDSFIGVADPRRDGSAAGPRQ
ncbi:MAG: gamma-glutamyltransferase [Elusimicrobiota bacterium]